MDPDTVIPAEPPRRRFAAFLRRYGDVFWWLHSLWALLIGAGMMWLGSRHYGLLRVAIFQIAFIWVASLVVPALVDRPPESSRWANRARLVINYFSKNFYQQLLFFLLPVYWASTTGSSWNMLFVGFVAISALLSTLDVVYDRHLSVKRSLLAVFFAFNLFACINVMLPLLWSISNVVAMRVSAVLAFAAFVTILVERKRLLAPVTWAIVVPTAIVLFATVEFCRPLIPPAPLRVVSATFGPDVDRQAMRVLHPMDRIDPSFTGRLYALTAVYAPMELRDRVGHLWYVNEQLVWATPYHNLVGGRKEGFRLWSSVSLKRLAAGSRVRVDIETEAGQLIGRFDVPVRPPASPTGDIRLPAPF